MIVWGLVTAIITTGSIFNNSENTIKKEKPVIVNNLKEEKKEFFIADLDNINFNFGITLNFIFDSNTSWENIDYNLLIRHINKDFEPSVARFSLGSITKENLSNYSFKNLITFDQKENFINIYVSKNHGGNFIGLAILNGYNNNKKSIAVDLSEVYSYNGKANLISHELAHIFGCTHSKLGNDIMRPNCDETALKFKNKDIKIINNSISISNLSL